MIHLLQVTNELLPRITCPTLVMHALEDHWVPPENATYILAQINSSQIELLWLENSYHIATLDHDQELIAQKVVQFIQEQ